MQEDFTAPIELHKRCLEATALSHTKALQEVTENDTTTLPRAEFASFLLVSTSTCLLFGRYPRRRHAFPRPLLLAL